LDYGRLYDIRVQSLNTTGVVFSPGNATIRAYTTYSNMLVMDPSNLRLAPNQPANSDFFVLSFDDGQIDENTPIGPVDVSGYEVKWDPPDGGGTMMLTPADGTAVIINNLKPNSRYTVTMRMYAQNGATQYFSPGLSKAIIATCYADGPQDPQNFKVATDVPSSPYEVTLKWLTANALGTALDGYKITYEPHNGVDDNFKVVLPEATSTVIENLNPGTTYEFNIAAFDNSGNYSPQNFYVSGTTTTGLYSATDFMSMGSTISEISFEWTPATTIEPGDSITSNKITATRTDDPEAVVSHTFPASGDAASNYTFTNLSAATEYTFVLTSYSQVGYSAEASSNVTASTSTSGAPSDPTLSSPTKGYGYVALNWTTPDSSGDSDLDHYKLKFENLDTNDIVEIDPIGSLELTEAYVSGLTSGTSYKFTIYAVNVNGKSSPGNGSAVLTVRTLQTGAPFEPNNLQVHPHIPAYPTAVTLMWDSAFKGTSPTAADIAGYIVHMSPAVSGVTSFYVGLKTTATIGGLDPQTTYRFYVEAKNTGNIGSGESVNKVFVTTPHLYGPGDAASLIQYYPSSSNTIPVSWNTASTEGGSNITGYQISYDSTDVLPARPVPPP